MTIALRVLLVVAAFVPTVFGQAVWSLADFQLLRVVELKGKTYHVQGVEVDDTRIWVTSVDRQARKAVLQEFSLADGRLLREAALEDGERIHPGGFQAAGDSLWIPTAEYKANSTTVVERRSKRTLEVEQKFVVNDHIGCLAVSGNTLIGGNWDSKDLYFWNLDGTLRKKVPNPTSTAFQDMKVDGGMLVGGGGSADGGAVEWIDLATLTPVRRLVVGRTDRGASYVREGMLARGRELMFLPEDTDSRLFVFRRK